MGGQPRVEAQRRTRLGRLLPDDVEALLVTALTNVRYLTGFTGSNGAVLVHRDGSAVFATDGRYVTQAAAEVPDLRCVESRAVSAALLEAAIGATVARLGVEREHLTIGGHERLTVAAGSRVSLRPLGELVNGLRSVKDGHEIDLLTTACEITDAGFAALLEALRPGLSERDIAGRLETELRCAGADGLAFDSIVASGPNGGRPHHHPTDRCVEPGELVTLDFGARYQGYCADMTRTVAVGQPADWQRELHDLVRHIQAELRAATVAGADPRGLNQRCRELVEASGHPLMHGLGHGVGLDVHEDPFLTSESTAPRLAPGSVVTVEPGVYLPDRGGVRIEDVVVVMAEGAPRALSTSPRELLEV